MGKQFEPTLALDFDGVIHSYRSGWKGVATVPDPPVSGAISYVALALREGWKVAIYSSRSHSWRGRRAMKRWLRKWAAHELRVSMWSSAPAMQERFSCWWHPDLPTEARTDEEMVQKCARWLVDRIEWPRHKPPAFVTLDDRVLMFDGDWPNLEELRDFKPWYKRTSPFVRPSAESICR